MSDVFSKFNHPDEFMQDVDKALFIAKEAQGSQEYKADIDQDRGLPVETASIGGDTELVVTDYHDPDPDVEKVGIHAETADADGNRTVTADVVHTEYSDGDTFATGKAEIRRVLDDGTEKVLETKDPERVKLLGRIIANRFVDEVNDDSVKRRKNTR